MDSFLLIVGLALFTTGAAMYLTHAAQHEPGWVAGSLLMPLMVPLYYRRHWEDLQLAGLLQSAGLAMSLAGGFMMVFEENPSQSFRDRDGAFFSSVKRNYSGFVDSDKALLQLARHGPGTEVAGRLNGADFHPDRVELIEGVLRMREGQGFVPDREIALFLDVAAPERGRLKKLVSPYHNPVPEIQVTWRDESGMPVTRVIRGGYRLDLELIPMARGKLEGYVQLTLPDAQESFVAGDLEVLTTHLRYRDGEVDRSFDHPDTLNFVAEEFLGSQYKAGDLAQILFSDGTMDPLDGRAEVTASVHLNDGRVGKHIIKAAKTEFGWSVLGSETAAATEAAGYKSAYNALPPAALREQQPRVARKESAPSVKQRTLPFGSLGSLAGQGADVELVNGRREQGVLRGVSNGKLLVEVTKKGGGVIEFKVAESEFASMRLNSGEVIRITGGPVARSESAGAQSGSAQESVRIGDRDFTRFMNKSVKVVTVEGKVTNGIFRGVNKDRLVVEIQVGGGKMDYNVAAAQLASIDFAGR